MLTLKMLDVDSDTKNVLSTKDVGKENGFALKTQAEKNLAPKMLAI